MYYSAKKYSLFFFSFSFFTFFLLFFPFFTFFPSLFFLFDLFFCFCRTKPLPPTGSKSSCQEGQKFWFLFEGVARATLALLTHSEPAIHTDRSVEQKTCKTRLQTTASIRVVYCERAVLEAGSDQKGRLQRIACLPAVDAV